jgi:hypothetical protein
MVFAFHALAEDDVLVAAQSTDALLLLISPPLPFNDRALIKGVLRFFMRLRHRTQADF